LLPPNYSAENAMRSAWLILGETKDASKAPVLTTCTRDSVANALFNMVTQGLSPAKHQCAFIARGNKLTMQRQYAGSIALARRFGGMKDIKAGTIYEGDEFEYEIIPETGRRRVVKHLQKMENIQDDITKIKGVYAVATFNDGTTDMLPMGVAQVRKSWSQGELGGKGPAHTNFPSSMAEKTVINKFCKLIIDSSDDAVLFTGNDDDEHGAVVQPLANHGPVVDLPETNEEPIQDAVVMEEPPKANKSAKAPKEQPTIPISPAEPNF